MDAFWRKRDLNPSTPENEFREEHYARLEYVNNWFGRDTFRRDGRPTGAATTSCSASRAPSRTTKARDEIYPAELWFYNNSELKRFGVPPFFYLLFWRRHGIGELQLYDPISDGPPALLTGYQPERRDFRDEVERAYEILYEFDPEIANAAMSFRTDEQDITRFQAGAVRDALAAAGHPRSPLPGSRRQLRRPARLRARRHRGGLPVHLCPRKRGDGGPPRPGRRVVPPLGDPGGRPIHLVRPQRRPEHLRHRVQSAPSKSSCATTRANRHRVPQGSPSFRSPKSSRAARSARRSPGPGSRPSFPANTG